MPKLNSESLRLISSMAELDHVLTKLRTSWTGDWMGLPCVLDACIDIFFQQTTAYTDTVSSLLASARDVVQQIEYSAQMTVEPSYHNRLHIADALTGLTCLLHLQTPDIRELPKDWCACLLLAVAAHDFDHPGGANASRHEIESMSVEKLQPILKQRAVEPLWQDRISQMILRTDICDVEYNHECVRNLPFEWNVNWSAVLLNEADILASASSTHGWAMGLSLAAEWKKAKLPLHEVVGTVQGRLEFLKTLRFSSRGSKQLGVEDAVQQQLHALSAV